MLDYPSCASLGRRPDLTRFLIAGRFNFNITVGVNMDADAARETVEKYADEAYATRAEFEVQLTPRKDLAGGWKAKSRMLTIKEARARAAKRAWVKDGADRKKA